MNTKIEWANHIIAFFSALLGILIAFQLDDYRDNRQENEKLQNSLHAIKNEIDNNLNIYKKNVDQLGPWFEYWKLISKADKDGLVTVKKNKFDSLNTKVSSRFKDWELIEQKNDSILVFLTTDDVVFDFIPQTGITVSGWSAALYSGIFNRLDSDLMIKLTLIYEWIEKDLGVSDREILEDQFNEGFDDIDVIIAYYSRIEKVHRLKLQRIKKIYDEIEWE